MSLCSFLFIFENQYSQNKKKMSKFFENFTKSHKIAFWICLGLSTAMLVSSFILPPTGKIDPSVLRAVGEIFAFAVLYVVIEALNRGTDVTLHKGDVDITLNNPDKVEDEK